MPHGNAKAIVLCKGDSVAVAAVAIEPGPVEVLCDAGGRRAEAAERIPAGHKIALCPIPRGAAVIKYGRPIGLATLDIAAGSWVHEHNLRSGLSGHGEYPAAADAYVWADRGRAEALLSRAPRGFRGYRRPDGSVGTRNELWVLPTVGCVNGSARMVAELARSEFGLDAQSLEHPFGCSQLGGGPAGDLDNTRRILARLTMHPNAAAAIVVSLGCENNGLPDFRAELGNYDPRRVAFLPLQEIGDEAEEARRILKGLAAFIGSQEREELPLSELSIGLKCGGSDGFSGITANPLAGSLCDLVVAAGGRAIMTEVPEMFGAEDALMARSASPEVYGAFASMLSSFKDYFISHGQEIYENPAPGNKEGGITTLEEKSLGCVRKAGSSPVADVLAYGCRATARGLSLVSGPGNDLVSATALAAAGAQEIIFTTGRGTPFGSVVPTIKVSTNSGLAERKPAWIDFDAGRILTGSSFDDLAVELLRKVVAVASGETTRAESGGHRGMAIFKDGVTL
ncbi:MAG: altronate dehydratase family protein [Rectinemataceae bacterium]